MKKMNKKGFTLAELLIVLAILAILIAIAIPVFSAQLENARRQADHANLRSAYAVVQTLNIMGADSEIVPGIKTEDDVTGAVYCTDGKFHKDITGFTAVLTQSTKHVTTGTDAQESCKACVVDCTKITAKNQTITITGAKTGEYAILIV